jgi:hypothetical protein
MSEQTQGAATPQASPVIDVKSVVAQAANAVSPESPTKEAPVEAKEEVKADDPMSPKFAALARRERKLTQMEKEFKDRTASQEAELAEYRKWKEAKANPKKEETPVKKSPYKVLKESGLSVAEINEWYLNGQQIPQDDILGEVEARVESRLEKMERERKEADDRLAKEREDAAKAEQEEAIANFRAGIKDHIGKTAEKYELTSLYDPDGEAVFNTINEYFEANKKVLTTDEACELVEKYLEGEFEKALKAKKVQSKLSPVKEETKDQGASADKPAVTQKTLANTLTGSGAPIPKAAKTDEERRRRAMEILSRGA